MNGLVDLLSDQIKVVANFDAIVDEDFEYVNDSIKKLFIVRSDVSKIMIESIWKNLALSIRNGSIDKIKRKGPY